MPFLPNKMCIEVDVQFEDGTDIQLEVWLKWTAWLVSPQEK